MYELDKIQPITEKLETLSKKVHSVDLKLKSECTWLTESLVNEIGKLRLEFRSDLRALSK